MVFWGYARFEDMKTVGQRINNFEDWKNEMIKLAGKAIMGGRLVNAAFYYRAAEFYTFSDDLIKKCSTISSEIFFICNFKMKD